MRLNKEIDITHHLHHHQIVLIARSPLTLSLSLSLSLSKQKRRYIYIYIYIYIYPSVMFPDPGRSSRLHPVFVNRTTQVCQFSPLGIVAFEFLRISLRYLVRLTWMFFKIEGRWPYSCCIVESCLYITRQDKNSWSIITHGNIYNIIYCN